MGTLCTFGPPAEREQRWILKFEDADVGDMHYATEPDAMRAWDRYKDTYTCTLFVTAAFVDYDRRRACPHGITTGLSCSVCNPY